MTKEEILKFDKTATQLEGLYNEFGVLVKKDPKTEVNEFKLKLINKVLTSANDILKDMKPFDDFESFDANKLPNNGDITMILKQYINCLEELRKDNVHRYSGYWYWSIDGDENSQEIRTYMPEKYRR